MTIFFCEGLTRNPEIGNTPVWVLPNIWRLRGVMDTKFGTNVSNRMLLYAAKFQGYSFYRFWVVKGKPTGGWISPSRQITGNVLISILSPSENRLKIYSVKFIWKHIYLNLFISEIFVYVCFSFLLETKRITRLLFKISLRFVNGIHHK